MVWLFDENVPVVNLIVRPVDNPKWMCNCF